MKPLRVRIIGSGGAAKKHAQAFSELPDLYRVVDSDDCDIVDVCTPPYLHYDQICAKLPSAHVIVEKPICGSLAEIDLLNEVIKDTGKEVFPIFQYRFAGYPTFGNHISTYWQRDDSYYAGWRDNPSLSLGGCLVSHGIHSVDLMICNYGRPSSVFVRSIAFDKDVETYCSIDMKWGADCTRRVTAEIGGSSRLAVLNESGDSQRGFKRQFQLISKHLNGNTQPLLPTLGDARESIEVITAAYYSALTGESVKLPLMPSHPFYQGWTKHFERLRQRSGSSLKTPVSLARQAGEQA
jgi:predicted dehydrogenase